MNKKILMILIMAGVFLVLASASQVQATRYGCCVKTTDGQYCKDGDGHAGISETMCASAGDFYYGACTTAIPEKCGLVQCALNNSCMDNVPRYECVFKVGGTPALGDECTQGCCGIAQRPANDDPIMTKKACYKLAESRDFPVSYVDFLANITREKDCVDHFDKYSRGCCVTSSNCSYTTGPSCSGDYFQGVLCEEIPTRCQTGTSLLKCVGNDIKWVNAAGDEKMNRTCSTPRFMCMQCANKTCTDDQYSNTVSVPIINPNSPSPTVGNYIVKQFEPYCEDTSCPLYSDNSVPMILEQSVDEKGVVTPAKINTPVIFTGNSICYNFYKSSSKTAADENSNSVTIMNGRSTGLQNHKLVCNYGKLEIVGLGVDRKTLCQDDPATFIAKTFTNDWEKCMPCGEKNSTGFWDKAGDLLSIGSGLGTWIGSQMGEQCNNKKCSNITSAEGIPLCFYSYDTTWAWGRDPGSCVPRFTPGTTDSCKLCGNSGDVWNICKQEEAYALGNCQFKHKGGIVQGAFFIASTVGFYGSNRLGWFWLEGLIRWGAKAGCTDPITCQFVTITKIITGPVMTTVNLVLGVTLNLTIKTAQELINSVGGIIQTITNIGSSIGNIIPNLGGK